MPLRSDRFIPRASTAVQALLAFALGCAPCAARAQQVVLSTTRSLDFGRFVAGSGGTITLSPSGLRSRSGGVVLLNSPNAGQAAFSASRATLDAGSSAVIISLPANGATRLGSGANSMAVGDFMTPDAQLAVGNGGVALAVGATLVVAPNQPPGNYAGSFSIIVNHQ